MVSVIEVYTILKNLANKEQKGFITPDVFNSFASVAQRKIINEMFDELELNKAKATMGRDAARGRSSYQSIKEDLATYTVKKQVGINETLAGYSHQMVGSSGSNPSDIYEIPSDCRKIISIRTQDLRPCALVYDLEKMDFLRESNLASTSRAADDVFPVALISNDIEIVPDRGANEKITVVYYRNPSVNPQIVTGPNNTFDTTNSVDFDLPEDYMNEVVYEIAKLLGVRLRDQNIQVFGDREAQQE